MESERTDKAPRSFQLTRRRLMVLLGAVIGLPILGFVLGLLLFAPLFLSDDVRDTKQQAANATADVKTLRRELQTVTQERDALAGQLTAEQQTRATAEARIAIAETARAEAVSRLQQLEEEMFQLSRRNAFYESFITPEVDLPVLQCFNISASYADGRVRYGVNFMKNDQDDRARVEATVQFRVRTGEAVLSENLSDAEIPATISLPVLEEKDIALVRDVRTTGSFSADLPQGGLRILDIRAVNAEGETLAHCWKDL